MKGKNYVTIDRFNTKLGIQYSDYASKKLKKDFWVVKKDFIYYMDDSKESYVYVPSGYLTDGASVPRAFWSIVPPWGKYGQCCVLHDYLCEYPYYFNGLTSPTLNRKMVNQIFNKAMKLSDVPYITRKTIYGGVELYRHTVNNGFEPKNVRKIQVEYEMREFYTNTGEWM